MRFEDRLPIDVPTTEYAGSRVLYLLLAITTTLGAAHHVDHIVRGNHVGWPLTHHVNPFTYSLAIYPIIAVGLYLTLTDRAGDGYWAGVFTLSAFMLAYFHISPWAVEPPQDVILLALIAAATLSAVYAILRVYRNRQQQALGQ